ncbi:GntR family transcriptional regulator [Bradyrhizobium sp. Pear77]|uniref:GntR family transcriptional regulator n=1 Tax=Bradyrhizobium altum TaxID=1571202 RepID=UPI001E611137|nr:GntR family transcriptional regulator [Bradyrhizobium altum]MCC8957347.1 GntR family transcriptional regulator [Bradyrhizobium altum]
MKRDAARVTPLRGRGNGDVAKDPSARDSTLTEEAYRKLRVDIISGVFPPGGALRLEALKERYGLSFSPLREALNRLHAERLVVSSALRGFKVTDFSLEEMRDAIETRVLIDVEGLKRSIVGGDDDWEGAVIAAFHALSRCAKRLASLPRTRTELEAEELEGRHRDFHSALISQCNSRWLIEFSSQLYAQTERYRRPMMDDAKSLMPPRDIEGEHRAIMEAAIARDANQASFLLEQHYRKTGSLIEQHLARSGYSSPLEGEASA